MKSLLVLQEFHQDRFKTRGIAKGSGGGAGADKTVARSCP
jgi:hypothetical protein